MQGKPKITINKFANMGDDGLFFLRNMATKKINGNTVLSSAWGTSYMFSEDTSGWSDINGAFHIMAPWTPIAGNEQEILGFTGNKLLSLDYSLYGTADENRGLIHTVDGSLASAYKAGLIVTPNNNILYTLEKYIGKGYKKTATSANATSITVTGTDFTALGVTAADSKRNKVYNLTKKERYTVTSVSGGSNETINFSTATTTPQAGDKIVVFIDDKFNLSANYTSAGNQFDGQSQPSTWVRQAHYVKGRGEYYFLNGNRIAKLSADEETFDDDYQQLPLGTQAYCMWANRDRILIGGEQNNQGTLILWDGITASFDSIIETTARPTAITAFKSGFIVRLGGAFQYTDGFSLTPYAELPDTNGRTSADNNYASILMYHERLVVANSITSYNRLRKGIYIYDQGYGWTFSPIKYGTKAGEASVSCLIAYSNEGSQVIVGSASTSSAAIAYPVFRLFENVDSGSSSATFYVKLPQKMNISLIELNLSAKIHYTYQEEISNATVTVNYGEGKKMFTSLLQAGNGSDSDTVFNNLGATRPFAAGQILEAVSGNIAGERTYITEIRSPGGAGEEADVSPAFSATPYQNGDLYKLDMYKAGTITVPANQIPTELLYNIPTFYSDKLFLEVFITAPTAKVDIHSINIY